MSPIGRGRAAGRDGEGGSSPLEQLLLHVSSLPLAPGPPREPHILSPPPPQNTKHYELLNYSEHGTTVDNVLYSCDFSEKTPPTPQSSIVAKVQSVISKLERGLGPRSLPFWTLSLMPQSEVAVAAAMTCCRLPSQSRWPGSPCSWAPGRPRRSTCCALPWVYTTFGASDSTLLSGAPHPRICAAF